MNVRDGQAQPLLVPARSLDEAIAQATQLRAEGYSFDVGLMAGEFGECCAAWCAV